jgi:hypothetical protein
MTSWKTTLGGALAALGTFLWGVPIGIKTAFPEFVLDPEIVKWCVLGGIIASGGGVLFMGLFGRDNNVTSEQANAGKAGEHSTFNIQRSTPKDQGGNMPVWILTAVLASGVMGCATRFIDKVAQARAASTKAAYRAGAEYNAWLQPRTNNPAAYGTTYTALMTTWTNVDRQARRVGDSAKLLIVLEDIYREAPTNQPLVLTVVSNLAAQTGNLKDTVKGIVEP